MSGRGKGALALAALVVLLVAARALLPLAIQRYVNRVLDRNESYEGSIGDVDVALWRGAYEIEDVSIRKRGGKVPVPFFDGDVVDLSIEWRALWDGALVGEMVLQRPQLNFVAGPSAAQSQAGRGADWRETVEQLFPVKLNRVEAHDGSIHYRNFHTEPQVNVYLSQVELVAENLTNTRDAAGERVAQLELRAVPMNAGRMRLRASFDPFAQQPTFDLDCVARGADLTQWNDFLRAHAGFDVERGRVELYAELESQDGRFDGYLMPFVEDLDVLDYAKEKEEQGFFASVWEALVGGASEIFEEPKEDRMATRIPISGRVESPRADFWVTLGGVVRHAFVEAFRPRLERSVGNG